ncbi:hypothetical protein N7453_011557 [Penicillium expansum]|nr:hypothetical protein N7453_011557 [Penicillium expansum]
MKVFSACWLETEKRVDWRAGDLSLGVLLVANLALLISGVIGAHAGGRVMAASFHVGNMSFLHVLAAGDVGVQCPQERHDDLPARSLSN